MSSETQRGKAGYRLFAVTLVLVQVLVCSCTRPTAHSDDFNDYRGFGSPLRVSPVQVLTPEGTWYQLLLQPSNLMSSSLEIAYDVKHQWNTITVILKGITCPSAESGDLVTLNTYIDLGYLPAGDYRLIFNVRGRRSESVLRITPVYFSLSSSLHPQIYPAFTDAGRFPSNGFLLLTASSSDIGDSTVASLLDSLQSLHAIPGYFPVGYSGYFRDGLYMSQYYTYGIQRDEPDVMVVVYPDAPPAPPKKGYQNAHLFTYQGTLNTFLDAVDHFRALADEAEVTIYLRLVDNTGFSYRP